MLRNSGRAFLPRSLYVLSISSYWWISRNTPDPYALVRRNIALNAFRHIISIIYSQNYYGSFYGCSPLQY